MIPRPGRLVRFLRDHRGVSAVEFALIAPVLIGLYCGMAELVEVMLAQRRVHHVASSVGDVVARKTRVTDADMANIFSAGASLMDPFTTAELRMCVASIVSDASGKDTVAWVDSTGTGASECPAKGAVVTDIPASVLPASQSVIVSKSVYAYESPIKVTQNLLTLRRTFYHRPRLSETVERTKT